MTRHIRKLSLHDLLPLHALIGRLCDFSPEEQAVARELVDAAARGHDYEVWVALDGDTLSGYVCFGRTPMTQATYDLYWLGVCPTQRKRGVGRDLVSVVLQEIAGRGGALVRVETSSREGYHGARAFYLSLGFGEAARLKNFYASEDDLIVFTREFYRPESSHPLPPVREPHG